MMVLTIKKHTVNNFVGLLLSVAYGFFVITSLQRLYLMGGSDISQYVKFFSDYDITSAYTYFSIRGDGVFRVGVN